MRKRNPHWQELLNNKEVLNETTTSEEKQEIIDKGFSEELEEKPLVERPVELDDEKVHLIQEEIDGMLEEATVDGLVSETGKEVKQETIDEESSEELEEKPFVERPVELDDEKVHLTQEEIDGMGIDEDFSITDSADLVEGEEVTPIPDTIEFSEDLVPSVEFTVVPEETEVETEENLNSQETIEDAFEGVDFSTVNAESILEHDEEQETLDTDEEIIPGVSLEDLLNDDSEEYSLDTDSEMVEEVAPTEEELQEEAKREALNTEQTEKKQSIFKKGFNAIKNAVCHPIKTLKKGLTTVIHIATLPFIGIGYFIAHPVKSLKNTFNAICHPVETYHNLKNGTKDNDGIDLNLLTAEELEDYYDRTYQYTQLMELDGEVLVKDEELEEENTKGLTEEAQPSRNKSALNEVNKNVGDFTPLSSLESEVTLEHDKGLTELADLESDEILNHDDDAVEVISDRSLQVENGSSYNLDRNNKYTNMPIDASEIDVNNKSLKFYEAPEKMFGTTNKNGYENINEKPLIKTKSYM